MKLSQLTVDLLAKILGYLSPQDHASFALTSSALLLVYDTSLHWPLGQIATSNSSSISATGMQPPGMGYIDRPRFLRPGERGGERVLLVSYPRSGNSMLRSLLEKVTGVVTGSDTRPDRVLSRSLLERGLMGEGVADNRVWLVKTHWPERYGCQRFTANKVVLLVRNPFDAMDSYFHMAFTNTHERTLRQDILGALRPLWDAMMPHELKVWEKFNLYWLTLKVPLFALRYEDLVMHTEEMLVRLMSFLEDRTPEGIRGDTCVMDRIRRAIGSNGGGRKPKGPYKPRSSGRIGTSLRHYRPQQLSSICKDFSRSLRAFGYDPMTQGFPQELLVLPDMARCLKNVGLRATITANKGRQIRGMDDEFGRSITKLRHRYTDLDRFPLPCEGEDSDMVPFTLEAIRKHGGDPPSESDQGVLGTAPPPHEPAAASQGVVEELQPDHNQHPDAQQQDKQK